MALGPIPRLQDFITINSVENNGVQKPRSDRYSKRGRALSPSRLHVLEHLEAQADATSVAALTIATGLHENTIRGHLSALHRDGFIDRVAEETDGRGRPQWLWFAHTTQAPAQAIEHSDMVIALAQTIEATTQDPTSAALAAGKHWGRALLASGKIQPTPNTPTEPYSATRRVSTFLADFGFSPRETGQDTIELHSCPILDQATKSPNVICPMHLGLVQGVLEADGVDASHSVLEPFPTPHLCVLRLK